MKTNFSLGGVHVHIDEVFVDLEIEYQHGIFTTHQQIAIGLHHGMPNDLIVDRSGIHKKIAKAALTTSNLRVTKITAHRNLGLLFAKGKNIICQILPQNSQHPFSESLPTIKFQ
ncbi:MAG: hypothetical protein ACD_62C00419G0004 [uncultured bacterium]|nr:MAG: hypothetical protein ACD_62C00419G0004 [uncultured bacterium]